MSTRELCPLHGEKDWVECWNCVCLDPEPNVRCDVCNGKGGWYCCLTCHPEVAEDIHG